MPGPSEPLVALEQRLAERLLAFERLDEAWPRGRTAIERTEIGRHREDALSEIAALRDRIVTSRAETLAAAAVHLRRLVVIADEGPRPRTPCWHRPACAGCSPRSWRWSSGSRATRRLKT